MNSNFINRYTTIFDEIVNNRVKVKVDTIFVLVGITPYVAFDRYAEHITDIDTFDKEGNTTMFTKDWFGMVFPKLLASQNYQILSHQQFAYINEYLTGDFFGDRIFMVYDNFRSLFPLKQENYIEGGSRYANNERPDELPIYQAEQLKINENYFYILKSFDDSFAKIPFFSHQKELELGTAQADVEFLSVISDFYSVDLFVNQCIVDDNFGKQVFVKISNKNVLNAAIQNTLQELNHVLHQFGGGVYMFQEEAISQDYTPKTETTALLKQYWGENAVFNNIPFYEDPNVSSNIIPLSQGLLVDTIINEYEKGRHGVNPRDIFITAPTGAGKSLIFQLPAFYAANKGDVTIVVSPLKALMKDQVEALYNNRRYAKAAFLNSDLTLIDRDRIIESCKKGDIDILYLSPELLLSYDIRYFLGERKLGLLIIDEAHLITTWGRDFRVDYWFLGNHINKIRKFNNYKFPLVALTATAVYGGINDMVNDSINSLNMRDPHKFIGDVRRKNIEFVIDTHDDYTGNYNQNKEQETIEFIQGIHNLGMKGIVYAPYTKHINKLKTRADQIDPNMVVAYHAKIDSDNQQYAYQVFKNNQCKIMLSTKAFGMGVDIPDVQVVYHHAPSGLLPDYVQEIGRASRDKNIQGYATLKFSKSDLRYSKQLFGMSSLKTFQLQAVMRRIIRHFNSIGKKRNMLMAADDFAYIFDDGHNDVDQKVTTALMMIEKDYLAKTRFNVLVARPKKVFTRVYARTNDVGISRLRLKYGNCFEEIGNPYNGYHTIELNLDSIWSTRFSDRSFPQLKAEFYGGNFLSSEGIDLKPQIKFSVDIEIPYNTVLDKLNTVFDVVNEIFAILHARNQFFSKDEYVQMLEAKLSYAFSQNIIEKIASFVLNTYSELSNENDAFLQRRYSGTQIQYQIFSTNYTAKIAQLVRIFTSLYSNNANNKVIRYLSINDLPLKNHIRLGSLLEIMNLGTFETTGGDDPKMFLRLNDPVRIDQDSKSNTYKNNLLESVKVRHEVSCELFEHFFINYFSNETRWSLIEDFFLGMSNDDIFVKYPPCGIVNHVDIVNYLKQNVNIATNSSTATVATTDNNIHYELFKPEKNKTYYGKNLLTIGSRVLAISKWVDEDPISLHKIIVEHNIRIQKEDFDLLVNKLRVNHFEYYRDYMGLNLLIEFPGYNGLVMASVPYKNNPVEFYKWWKKKENKNKIRLTYKEQIELFLKVDEINSNALIKEHKAKIGK